MLHSFLACGIECRHNCKSNLLVYKKKVKKLDKVVENAPYPAFFLCIVNFLPTDREISVDVEHNPGYNKTGWSCAPARKG